MKKYLAIIAAALALCACGKDKEVEMLSDYFLGGEATAPPAYNQYLGTWRTGSRTITLAEKEAGKSYTLTDSGFGASLSAKYKPVVGYDARTGSLNFTFVSWGKEDNWEPCFVGIDNSDNILEGNESADGLLARAKLSADGNSFVIKAVAYTLEEKQYKATSLGLWTYHWKATSEYGKGWFYYTDSEELPLPATFTR